MDHHLLREKDLGVDLEIGNTITYDNEEGNPNSDSGLKQERKIFTKLCERFTSVDDNLVKSGINPSNVNEGSLENDEKLLMELSENGERDFTKKGMGKETHKKGSSAKKAPKPPRPPRGFSLDAADQKLIKELAEMAMIRRARIERMKALKQKKALKASSSSSNGSLFAILFTTIFFVLVLFQGMSCQSSGATSQGSPQTTRTNESDLIIIQESVSEKGLIIQDQLHPFASDSILHSSTTSSM